MKIALLIFCLSAAALIGSGCSKSADGISIADIQTEQKGDRLVVTGRVKGEAKSVRFGAPRAVGSSEAPVSKDGSFSLEIPLHRLQSGSGTPALVAVIDPDSVQHRLSIALDVPAHAGFRIEGCDAEADGGIDALKIAVKPQGADEPFPFYIEADGRVPLVMMSPDGLKMTSGGESYTPQGQGSAGVRADARGILDALPLRNLAPLFDRKWKPDGQLLDDRPGSIESRLVLSASLGDAKHEVAVSLVYPYGRASSSSSVDHLEWKTLFAAVRIRPLSAGSASGRAPAGSGKPSTLLYRVPDDVGKDKDDIDLQEKYGRWSYRGETDAAVASLTRVAIGRGGKVGGEVGTCGPYSKYVDNPGNTTVTQYAQEEIVTIYDLATGKQVAQRTFPGGDGRCPFMVKLDQDHSPVGKVVARPLEETIWAWIAELAPR